MTLKVEGTAFRIAQIFCLRCRQPTGQIISLWRQCLELSNPQMAKVIHLSSHACSQCLSELDTALRCISSIRFTPEGLSMALESWCWPRQRECLQWLVLLRCIIKTLLHAQLLSVLTSTVSVLRLTGALWRNTQTVASLNVPTMTGRDG